MKLYKVIFVLLIYCGISFQASAFSKAPKVLIYSKTLGFRHKSIPKGIIAIQKLGRENSFDVDTTEDSGKFTFKNLRKYKAIIFLSPTGDDLFNDAQKAAFQQFIRNGGGFVGIHAATDCLFNWDWYGKLVGAYFVNHPKVQQARLIVTDFVHPSTADIPSPWIHTDEWYNFRSINPDIKKLINLDEQSYQGGKNGEDHPISWYHFYDGAKVFYTGLGHTEEAYQEELFLKHILGGIKYAMGLQ